MAMRYRGLRCESASAKRRWLDPALANAAGGSRAGDNLYTFTEKADGEPLPVHVVAHAGSGA